MIDGIAYAFFDIAFVIFIRERAPAGQNATYQAFFLVTLTNLLTIIAAPYIGRIFDTNGGYVLYKIAFGGIFLSLIVFSFTAIPKTESKKS